MRRGYFRIPVEVRRHTLHRPGPSEDERVWVLPFSPTVEVSSTSPQCPPPVGRHGQRSGRSRAECGSVRCFRTPTPFPLGSAEKKRVSPPRSDRVRTFFLVFRNLHPCQCQVPRPLTSPPPRTRGRLLVFTLWSSCTSYTPRTPKD